MTQVLALSIPSQRGRPPATQLMSTPSPSSGTESLFQCETTGVSAQTNQPHSPGSLQTGTTWGQSLTVMQNEVCKGGAGWPGLALSLPSLPVQSTDVRLSLQHHHVITRGTGLPLGALEQDGTRSLPIPRGCPSPGCLAPGLLLHERRQ